MSATNTSKPINISQLKPLNSIKSQPKPILKKADNNKKVKTSIETNDKPTLFYTCNEIEFNDELNDSLIANNCLNDSQLIDDFQLLNLQDSPNASSPKERFRYSSLTSKNKDRNSKRARFRKEKPQRRAQSAVFLMKDINKEIIKLLIKSTEGFHEEFKKEFSCRSYTDSDLFKNFRKELLSRLKEFLTEGNSNSDNYYDRMHAYEIGLTLSEPLLADIAEIRIKNKKEKLKQPESQNIFQKSLLTASIDSSGNMIKEESVYGSLPNHKFFDFYMKNSQNEDSDLIEPESTNQNDSIEHKTNSTTFKKSFKAFLKEKNKNLLSEATANRKIVRFADSFGLDLENIRIITNNSFIDAFTHSSPDDHSENEIEKPPTLNKPFLVLMPLFSIRKIDAIVKLDNFIYDYENKLIRCMIRVKNLSFQKRVFARITFNSWKTHHDLDAIYIKSETSPNSSIVSISAINNSNIKISNYNQNDYFAFCIILPEKQNIMPNLDETNANRASISFNPCDEYTLKIEFAICYTYNETNDIWDNNGGENYKFQCLYSKNS